VTAPGSVAWHIRSASPRKSLLARERNDCFGNPVRELAIEFPHRSLSVRAESTIDVLPHLPAA
jgi:hypothetical protein